MTDDDYELWSPKEGEIYPQGYQWLSNGTWIEGDYPGRPVSHRITTPPYRRPKTNNRDRDTDMIPPEGYELWSPKKGDVYPQGYLFRRSDARRWLTGNYSGLIYDDCVGLVYCKPITKTDNKTDPSPQGQLTMDKAFITQRPQYSNLLAMSLIAYEVSEHVQCLADATTSADVVLCAEAIDELIDMLRGTADQLLFTDHKDYHSA